MHQGKVMGVYRKTDRERFNKEVRASASGVKPHKLNQSDRSF